VIVSQAEINIVTRGRCRRLLLPVERGELGELLSCPLEEGRCFSLQPAAFVKGTRVTCTSVEVSTSGHVEGALIGPAHSGPTDRAVWVITFVLGDRSAFYSRHRERYLKAKGVGLTDDPNKAVRGEPAVTEEEQLAIAAAASARREAAVREEFGTERQVIKAAIGRLRKNEFSTEIEKDLRFMERRLAGIERKLKAA
jgi:hypothetical protein